MKNTKKTKSGMKQAWWAVVAALLLVMQVPSGQATPLDDEPLPSVDVLPPWVFVVFPDVDEALVVNPLLADAGGPSNFTMDVDIEGQFDVGQWVHLIVTTEEVEATLDGAANIAQTAPETARSSKVESSARSLAQTIAEFSELVQIDYNLVTFDGVPAVRGAQYVLMIDGKRFPVEPFVEEDDVLLESIPLSSGCTSTRTLSDFRWIGVGRYAKQSTSSWDVDTIAAGAWKYGWEYWPECNYGQHHIVRPSFGFSFYGQNRLAIGGSGQAHTLHVAAPMDGERFVDCKRYWDGKWRCEGHRVTLHNPKVFYRTTGVEGVAGYAAQIDGRTSTSCQQILPEFAHEAIAVISLKYPWVGLGSFIPEKYCSTNWKKMTNQQGTGLGIHVTGTKAYDGEEQVTGSITMKYTTTGFKFPELQGTIYYNLWMSGCKGCNNISQASGHHMVTKPVFEAVRDQSG